MKKKWTIQILDIEVGHHHKHIHVCTLDIICTLCFTFYYCMHEFYVLRENSLSPWYKAPERNKPRHYYEYMWHVYDNKIVN